MKRVPVVLAAACALAFGLAAPAEELINPGFDIDFGAREDRAMWGDFGETFGQGYQVEAGKDPHPIEARSGSRMLVINVPVTSWNGVWQQVPWRENASFTFKAYYMIRKGSLHEGCATFMKVEFFDAKDNKISDISGEGRKADTAGRWILDTLRGTTPPETASLRVVLIAGENPDGPAVENRIYWDDASLGE